MEIVDFRSDTVTRPTPEMREAMAAAVVGDDVYGEDPTVNALQEKAAEMMGMEAGLLVPTGTMGNLASLLAHCNRGDEVIMGNQAHTFRYEAGGLAALGGVQSHLLTNQPDGTILLEDIRGAIRGDDAHFPVSRLIALENTHNRANGAALSAQYTQSVADLAHEHGMKLHIDGARIINAAAALSVDVSELTSPADSVTFCLSKGLCAPVGSLICGSKEFIYKAHRARKQLGGGMRQAGIIAAAGLVALDKMVSRLPEDHRRAVELATGLDTIAGVSVEDLNPKSNMVYFKLAGENTLSPDELVKAAKAMGVLFGHAGGGRFRMVTHYWVGDEAVKTAVEVISAVVSRKS